MVKRIVTYIHALFPEAWIGIFYNSIYVTDISEYNIDRLQYGLDKFINEEGSTRYIIKAGMREESGCILMPNDISVGNHVQTAYPFKATLPDVFKGFEDKVSNYILAGKMLWPNCRVFTWREPFKDPRLLFEVPSLNRPDSFPVCNAMCNEPDERRDEPQVLTFLLRSKSLESLLDITDCVEVYYD